MTDPVEVQRAEVETSLGATDQVLDALSRLNIDPTRLPRLPWDTVHEVCGPLWPTDIWCVAAATGNGKTTVLAHLIEHWVMERTTVYVMSLEQDPMEIRTALAALACHFHVQRVLENDWHGLPRDAKSQIARHLQWQDREARAALRFHPRQAVTIETIEHDLMMAAHVGAKVIILDHIGMVDLGPGNQHAMLKLLCRILKSFVNHLRIPIVMAAQINRGDRDPIAPYQPPNVYSIEGGEVIRQIASVALGLYRPLVETFDTEDARQVRTGRRKIGQYVKPNTIGVHVMKHRLRGGTLGDLMELPYEHGRITCPKTLARVGQEDRWDI